MAITGYGVITSNAHNARDFGASLRSGKSGLRLVEPAGCLGPIRVAGQITDLDADALAVSPSYLPKNISEGALKKLLRSAPLGLKASLLTAMEAHASAGLQGAPYQDHEKGLIVGGSNLHQNLIYQNILKYQKTPEYLNALHSLVFFDTHQVGLISEILKIKGLGFTVGGASASGNLTILQAFRAVRQGDVPLCYCIGGMADFSPIEFQGFANLGALHTGEHEQDPANASRPFDEKHAGFVFGQGAACLILEDLDLAKKRGAVIHAEILSAEMALDATHLTDPSMEGESRVMKAVLDKAGIEPKDVEYLNAHGTASPLGDKTELAALDAVFGESHPSLVVNSTKSIIGHCLTSAGSVEMVATLLQMKDGFVHPNLTLREPMPTKITLVGRESKSLTIRHAISNSFGFGGINSAVLIRAGHLSK